MKYWNFFLAITVLFYSCRNGDIKNAPNDSAESKTVRMSIDESFEPVMKEQIKVFEVAYPDTKVLAEYKPEAECLRDLQKDSTKIVIISRELSRAETAFFDSKISYKPEFAQLAKDAVAIIINTENTDSAFTLSEIKNLLSNSNNKVNLAIDGNTSTSTVRYLKDSLLKGGNFGKNVTGAKSSEDLVKYIATTPGAIGFVGISWITNPQTKAQEKLLQHVKMAMVECKR